MNTEIARVLDIRWIDKMFLVPKLRNPDAILSRFAGFCYTSSFVILFICSIHAEGSALRVAQSYPGKSGFRYASYLINFLSIIKLESIPMVRDKQSL